MVAGRAIAHVRYSLRAHAATSRSRLYSSLSGAREGNLVRVESRGRVSWASLSSEKAGERRLARLLDADGAELADAIGKTSGEEIVVDRVLAPLPVRPAPAIIFMGLNYRSHAAEVGKELPRFPVFAFKNPMSVAGPDVPISIPRVAREKPEVDFEGELAIVIGREVRDVSPSDALDAVLGVTAANDVSARRWQGKKGGGQWSRSKSFDTFCPLGPSILPVSDASTRAALASGGSGLKIRSVVNETVMQDSVTSDMMFDVAAIVSYLSEGTTLLPGTIILTGTPPGVGYVRKPPCYLKAGDKVEIELEGVGRLCNMVEDGP